VFVAGYRLATMMQMKQSILLMDNGLAANAARRAVLSIDSGEAHMC